MRTVSEVKSTTIFYGWWLVLVCLLVQAVAAGISIYFYSLLAGEVEREFSSGRALVMLGLTGSAITTSLLAPKMGDWLDRHSIRLIVSCSAIVMGTGFFAMSYTPTVWGFIASYAVLVAAGTVTLSMLFAPVLLSRWFLRQRGLATGVAALGTQLGGFVVPPLIALVIEAYDWRIAVRAVGLTVAVLIPLLSWRTVIDRPQLIGRGPDGDDPSKAELAADTDSQRLVPGLTTILRDRSFWLAGFGIAVMVAMFTTVLANIAFFALDRGADRDQAAWLVSLYALVGIVFSPLVGRFCDQLDIRVVFAGLLSINVVALLLLRGAQDYQDLVYATAMVAVSGGGFMPFWGAMIGRLFPLPQYGTVMGAMTLFAISASSLAPVLSGVLFDATGDYQVLLLALTVLMVVALLCVPLIRSGQKASGAAHYGSA